MYNGLEYGEIVDINRENFPPIFFLKDYPCNFTHAIDGNGNVFLIDLDENTLYSMDDVVSGCYNFGFYKKEDDEDFLGVAVGL